MGMRMSAVADDDCTYCGTGGAELAVARRAIFADWQPEDTRRSIGHPSVPACRHCAREVRRVQLRLWLTWGLTAAPEQENEDARRVLHTLGQDATEPRRVDARALVAAWVERQSAAWRGGSLGRSIPRLSQAVTSADPRDVEVMTRRLVRALFRRETNELLPMDATIQSAQLSSERPSEVLRAIVAQGLERRELQPGIVYWFARAADSACGSIWYAAIWSRVFLFAKTYCP
jgi:hypothetical protein